MGTARGLRKEAGTALKQQNIHPQFLFACCISFIVRVFVSTRLWTSQGTLVVKNPPDNAGDLRDVGSIPGSGRLPGGGHGNPLQYSCLENSMDGGAW